MPLYETRKHRLAKLEAGRHCQAVWDEEMIDNGDTAPVDFCFRRRDGSVGHHLEVKDRRGERGEDRDVDHFDHARPAGWVIETQKIAALLKASSDEGGLPMFGFVFRSGVYVIDVRGIAGRQSHTFMREDRGDPFDEDEVVYVTSADLTRVEDTVFNCHFATARPHVPARRRDGSQYCSTCHPLEVRLIASWS